MNGKKPQGIHKLSDQIRSAAFSITSRRLDRLRRFIDDANQAASGLAQVADGLKKVTAPPGEPFRLTTSLADNVSLLKGKLANCDDVNYREFAAGNRRAVLLHVTGLTDTAILDKDVLETLMAPEMAGSGPGLLTDRLLTDRLLTAADLTTSVLASDILEKLFAGNAVLLIDGLAKAFLIGAVSYPKRAVESPKTQTAARGPHEGFNESLTDNIALVRRRSRDSGLKVKLFQVGRRSRTDLAIIYHQELVKPGLAEEVKRRLARVDMDQVLFSAQLEEWLVDHPWSPFPQTLATERPETLVAAVYEGRVALILDNTPHALIIPCTFSTLLQASEDFTIQPVVASLIRLSRYIAAFLGTFLPSIYIAIVAFNPGMLPTPLAITVAELRARTPYPAVMEVLIMEAILELFQEGVLRLPEKIAPAATIVGGFVIGTTIVQAGIANALLVVAIAGTAIASYTMPSYNLGLALRWLRIPTIFMTAILGFYGLVIAYLAIVVHMCGLRSFGESYLGGLFDITLIGDMRDKLVRLPVTWLRDRPKMFGAKDTTRTGDTDG